MLGEIRKIDQLKRSANQDETFIRVHFRMWDSQHKRFWAKTDLVPGFRNYQRWQVVLAVGNVLSGLRMRNKHTVEADSMPVVVKEGPRNTPPWRQKAML